MVTKGGRGGRFGTIKSRLSECFSDLILIGTSTVQYHHQLESDNTGPINMAVAMQFHIPAPKTVFKSSEISIRMQGNAKILLIWCALLYISHMCYMILKMLHIKHHECRTHHCFKKVPLSGPENAVNVNEQPKRDRCVVWLISLGRNLWSEW